jgi:hypothetical protein
MIDGKLAQVEGSLNCLVQSQLAAAQQLAEQLRIYGIEALQQLPPGTTGAAGATGQLSTQVSHISCLQAYANCTC